MSESNKFNFTKYIENYDDITVVGVDDNACICMIDVCGYSADDLTATLSLLRGQSSNAGEGRRQIYRLTIARKDQVGSVEAIKRTKFARYADKVSNAVCHDHIAGFDDNVVAVLNVKHPEEHNLSFLVDCVDGIVFVKIEAVPLPRKSSSIDLPFGECDRTVELPKSDKSADSAPNTDDVFDRINSKFETKQDRQSRTENGSNKPNRERRTGFDDLFSEIFDDNFDRAFNRWYR